MLRRWCAHWVHRRFCSFIILCDVLLLILFVVLLSWILNQYHLIKWILEILLDSIPLTFSRLNIFKLMSEKPPDYWNEKQFAILENWNTKQKRLLFMIIPTQTKSATKINYNWKMENGMRHPLCFTARNFIN